MVAAIIDVIEEVSMPKELDGLPLHPLVVHAVVVLVPLTALVAVLFLVPRFRRALRWPMVLLGLAALVSTYVARESGENFEESIITENSPDVLVDAVERHEELATQLWYVVIGFFIVACVAAYVLRPTDEIGPFPGEDAEDRDPTTTLDTTVRVVVAILVIVGAVAAGAQTYRTGEQGSRAVWNPDGSADYSLGGLE